MATMEQPLAQVTAEKELSLLDRIAAENSARYMPTLTVKQFTEREKQLRDLKEMLVEKIDYGTIPGTDKPVLLLPGAQKICTFFGYAPHYELESIEDWNGKQHGEPLFYYKYTCVLSKDGKPVGEGQGSCNSWESKYRYRWVTEPPADLDRATLLTRDTTLSEFTFSVDKAETSGKYGKPAAYWQRFKDAIADGTARKGKRTDSKGTERDTWEIGGTSYRIPNDQFADIINTCQKMGQKRAYVAATLSATGASQYFTQDLEDSTESLDQVRDRRISEERSKAEPDAPELAELIAKSAEDEYVAGDLIQALNELKDGQGNKAYIAAQKTHGKDGPSTRPNIIRFLYAALKEAKELTHA